MTTVGWVYTVYGILCIVAAATFLAWTACRRGAERAARRRERLYGERYMRLVTLRMLDGDTVPMSRFPMCDRRGAKAVLARSLAEASASTCFDETCAVRRMMAANGIEGWLLRRIKHSHGCRRAYYMSMLSSLPVSCTTAEYLRRYACDRNRHIRFRTLLVGIAAEPSDAVRLLAEYASPLTPFELAELTTMLRRGLLPIACEPLLRSPHDNLRMLGLNIVRIFGVVDTEPALLELLDRCGAGIPGNRIVDVLVSLHLPVSRREVVACVRAMTPAERRRLFRRLAAEGYSAEAICRLAEGGERRYVESLVASYKRSIVCRPLSS